MSSATSLRWPQGRTFPEGCNVSESAPQGKEHLVVSAITASAGEPGETSLPALLPGIKLTPPSPPISPSLRPPRHHGFQQIPRKPPPCFEKRSSEVQKSNYRTPTHPPRN